MLLLIFGAIGLGFFLFDNISANFQTNAALNGLIFIIIGIGCAKCFQHNYSLFLMAKFVKKIEKSEEDAHFDEDSAQILLKRMAKQAPLLNMLNMQRAIEKMGISGVFQIPDHDSKLIKSKLGMRVRNENHFVGYLAGVLVMLGLIGTFWGLLITIASVGDAMGEVSKSMASQASSEDSMAAMSQFIEGISKPLQGMGVAFSSSLFGLTGSLFIGVLNFFAGHSQNRFMEDFAQWLDLHIPLLPADINAENTPQKDAGMNTELQSWLSAFIKLSAQSNRRMGMMFSSIAQLVDKIDHSNADQSLLVTQQRETQGQLGKIRDVLAQIQTQIQSAQSKFTSSSDPLVEAHHKSTQSFEKLSGDISQQMAQMNSALQDLKSVQIAANDLQQVHQAKDGEIAAKTNELSQISVQISNLLQEIDQNNTSFDTLLSQKPDDDSSHN